MEECLNSFAGHGSEDGTGCGGGDDLWIYTKSGHGCGHEDCCGFGSMRGTGYGEGCGDGWGYGKGSGNGNQNYNYETSGP
jgi:hypothetical protein